jgi:16S rRNA (uracil1498-N3)-methyltransferase
MRRFFIEPENISGSTAVLTGTEARHISTVLRLSQAAVITLFDGSGSYYEAQITRISPARVETKILSITPYIDAATDVRPALHLAVGLLKGKKMDFIIQKCTELGVEGVYPFRSEYCAVHDAAAERLSRWHKIALEACKQCNRPKPPSITAPQDLGRLLSMSGKAGYDLKVIFWENQIGQKTMREIFAASEKIGSVMTVIGPEGGFSSDEIAQAVDAGFKAVTMGQRILRAETAAIAAVAVIQHELGNLS